MTLRRSSPPRRRSPLARSTTPIKKVNVARKAKRRKSYAQKLAAYKRSGTYQIVAHRSQGVCEVFGCLASDGLQHHHLTYARFGGDELPTDVIVLCKRCHEAAESLHPTRNRNYSR